MSAGLLARNLAVEYFERKFKKQESELLLFRIAVGLEEAPGEVRKATSPGRRLLLSEGQLLAVRTTAPARSEPEPEIDAIEAKIVEWYQKHTAAGMKPRAAVNRCRSIRGVIGRKDATAYVESVLAKHGIQAAVVLKRLPTDLEDKIIHYYEMLKGKGSTAVVIRAIQGRKWGGKCPPQERIREVLHRRGYELDPIEKKWRVGDLTQEEIEERYMANFHRFLGDGLSVQRSLARACSCRPRVVTAEAREIIAKHGYDLAPSSRPKHGESLETRAIRAYNQYRGAGFSDADAIAKLQRLKWPGDKKPSARDLRVLVGVTFEEAPKAPVEDSPAPEPEKTRARGKYAHGLTGEELENHVFAKYQQLVADGSTPREAVHRCSKIGNVRKAANPRAEVDRILAARGVVAPITERVFKKGSLGRVSSPILLTDAEIKAKEDAKAGRVKPIASLPYSSDEAGAVVHSIPFVPPAPVRQVEQELACPEPDPGVHSRQFPGLRDEDRMEVCRKVAGGYTDVELVRYYRLTAEQAEVCWHAALRVVGWWSSIEDYRQRMAAEQVSARIFAGLEPTTKSVVDLITEDLPERGDE